MLVEGVSAPAPLSEEATGIRAVLDLLLPDMALERLDPATIAWDRPLFVLRSAHMARMRAFLSEVAAHCSAPALHVMSHQHDEATIREIAGFDVTFHPYPDPGRYRLESIPGATLEQLKALKFGTAFFLDAGISGDGLEEVERLLGAVDEQRMVSFRGDGTFARTCDWRLRRVAEAAFLRLVAWYHLKLDAVESGLK